MFDRRPIQRARIRPILRLLLLLLPLLAAPLPACATVQGGGQGAAQDSGTLPPQDSGPLSTADAASPLDGGTDGATPRDASPAPSDGAAPIDAAPITGLSWPPGQAFPTFAPTAATLDVVNEPALMGDSGVCDLCTLMATLEGLINRKQPRIWLSYHGSPDFWLSQLDAGTNPVADPLSLITKYRSEIAGIIVYDDTVPDTLNLATTMAGVQGGIVSSPALATTLTAAPYNLAVLADLRTNAFDGGLAVYQYELDNYAAQTTHRLITGLELTVPDFLRDYTVATKATMVWLDPSDAAQAAMLDQFLALLDPISPYVGWWPIEGPGVATASSYGSPTFAADFSTNLTVLGGAPRGSVPPFQSPPPPLENKMYIAIFMSDGDNLQEDEGLLTLKWADANRGAVPISWTIDPALVDVAPIILRYYQSSATVNDALVSGPSGLGYTYPEAWNTTTFDTYAQVSAQYLTAAGLDVITVWNDNVDLSAANAQSYATYIPSLLGMTIQNDMEGTSFINNALPLDGFKVTYAGTEQELESGLTGYIAQYNGSQPCFAAIQGNMNSGTITPSAFLDVRNYYAGNANIVFVRGDQYFQLMRRANAPPQHVLYPGDVNGDGKTDVFFYYSGDGSEWFGISNGSTLTWSKAGNISNFGNLLDGAHELFTGDFNGDAKTDFAFYDSGDQSVWLGTSTGTAFTWAQISTTTLGNWLDGAHRVHVADYNGDDKADFSVYEESTDEIWFGLTTVTAAGTTLTWDDASSVAAYGNLLDGSHVFLDGDFNGDGKQDVFFYGNGDGNLWLGASAGTTLDFSNVGNVSGFGNLIEYDRQLVSGDFNGDGTTDLAFYFSGDGSTWLGISTGASFNWSLASKTPTSTNLIDWNHRLLNADVNGDGKLDFVSYDAQTGAWNVGISTGTAFTWGAAGSAAAYGDLADYAHLLWLGNFDGTPNAAPFFYASSTGDFTMGDSSGTAFTLHSAGNVSGFGDLAQ